MNSPASFVKSLLAQCCLGGICEWVVCPGARNMALLQVLAAAEDLVKWTHFDERSAAFFALGRIQDMGLPVAVVGGGNSGVEAAIDLAGIASSVVLLQRGSELTSDKVLQEKLLSLPNVTVKYRASTSKLTGSNKLEKLFYLNRETGETESIDVDGCFVQIGLKPNTEWLDGAVELNAYGEVAVSDRCTTSAPGLFAAGDCTSVPYKQIVIALGEGAKASLSAFDYLIRQGA